jgi:hypothetical protein
LGAAFQATLTSVQRRVQPGRPGGCRTLRRANRQCLRAPGMVRRRPQFVEVTARHRIGIDESQLTAPLSRNLITGLRPREPRRASQPRSRLYQTALARETQIVDQTLRGTGRRRHASAPHKGLPSLERCLHRSKSSLRQALQSLVDLQAQEDQIGNGTVQADPAPESPDPGRPCLRAGPHETDCPIGLRQWRSGAARDLCEKPL